MYPQKQKETRKQTSYKHLALRGCIEQSIKSTSAERESITSGMDEDGSNRKAVITNL